jgi:hypothetical protein
MELLSEDDISSEDEVSPSEEVGDILLVQLRGRKIHTISKEIEMAEDEEDFNGTLIEFNYKGFNWEIILYDRDNCISYYIEKYPIVKLSNGEIKWINLGLTVEEAVNEILDIVDSYL